MCPLKEKEVASLSLDKFSKCPEEVQKLMG